MEEFINGIIAFFTSTGVLIAKVIALVIFGLLAIRLIMRLTRSTMLKNKKNPTTLKFLLAILNVGLYVVLFFAVASTAGISTTSFLAALSAVGLAISLALKDSLSNIANGLIIVSTKPFVEGDKIMVNGTEGIVKNIGLFNSKLLTADNSLVTLPNSILVSSTVTTVTANSTRRLDMLFNAAYGTDVEKVKDVLLKTAKAHKNVLDAPAPTARLNKQNDSALEFVLKVWVPRSSYADVYFDLMESMVTAFNENNIEVPFNQLDLNIKNPVLNILEEDKK